MAEPVTTQDRRPDEDPPRTLFVTPTHDTIRVLLASGGGAAMKLWFALALRADWRTGEAYPSYETLKRDHGFSSNCIAAGIADLEKMQLLERRRRFGNSTRYFIKGFARVGGSSLNSQSTQSQFERTDKSSPLKLRESEISKGEASPLNSQGQSSHLPEANEPQGTTSSRNEKGGASASSRPLKSELELVRLTIERRMLATSHKQRIEVVRAIVGLMGGLDAAAEALRGDGFGGWDLLDVHRAIASAKSRGDPPKRLKPPDPNCPKCRGSGRRHNPYTGADFDCRCRE